MMGKDMAGDPSGASLRHGISGVELHCAQSLSANLRQSIQEGIDSGPAIPADQVFAELNARYAEPTPATKPIGKCSA